MGGYVLQAIMLGLVSFALWLLLSGYLNDPLLIGLGVLSCALVAVLIWRMEQLDPETGLSLRLNLQQATYGPWLLWQIVLSNIDVARRILDPQLPISPTMIRLTPTQRTELGRVIYANSITLTPGTVTTDLTSDALDVHTLTREAADALLAGEMDRRVTELEGRR